MSGVAGFGRNGKNTTIIKCFKRNREISQTSQSDEKAHRRKGIKFEL